MRDDHGGCLKALVMTGVLQSMQRMGAWPHGMHCVAPTGMLSAESSKTVLAAIGAGAVAIALAQGLRALWSSYKERKASRMLEEYPFHAIPLFPLRCPALCCVFTS